MKPRNILLTLATLALTFPLLTGCGEQPDLRSDVEKAIDNLASGFTMNGVVTQTRNIKRTDLSNNETEVIPEEKNVYNVEVLYENSNERTGTSITHKGSLEGQETIIDYLSAYLDEDGNCYQEYLDYKNEVQIKHTYENGNKLSFAAAGLYNFASILNESDITYSKELGTYLINPHKLGLFLANILGRVNTGFYYSPMDVTLKIEDGAFKNLDVKMEDYQSTDIDNNLLVEIIYSNKVSFTFDKIGETKLPRITPYAHKTDNGELETALKEINKNFTMDVHSSLRLDGGPYNKTYREFRFSDDQILVLDYTSPNRKMLTESNHFILKKLENSESDLLYSHCYDIASDTYIKKEHKRFAKNYQGIYYFEDLLPAPSKISSDFFTYDQSVNEYICEDDAVLEEIKDMLIVSKAPLQNDAALNGNKIGIRINHAGKIEYIRFYVNYQDLFSGSHIQGDVFARFSKIGGTTI